jgi:hypothetical protein
MLNKDTEEKLEIWVLEYIERPKVIQTIRTLREEWQEAAGLDLYKAEGNVGLILYDVCRLLELTPEECILALGHSAE